jgi:hypothetical protein
MFHSWLGSAELWFLKKRNNENLSLIVIHKQLSDRRVGE